MSQTTQQDERQKAKPGRPETRRIKLDATPEQVARAIFANVPRPDPRKRKASK